MKCPECLTDTMAPRLTTKGVELDECRTCGSIWFDRGEILFYVRAIRTFDQALADATRVSSIGDRCSPVSNAPMADLVFPGGGTVARDPETGGVWVPGTEAASLRHDEALDIRWHAGAVTGAALRFRMPNLVSRSIFTLAGLYAVLSLALITMSLYAGLSAGACLLIAVAVAAIQFAIGPFMMDLMLRFAYRARKEPFEALPANLQDFTRQTCERNNMKIPQFWIIEDLSPNAFTYGHVPNNARLALTEGVFELLDDDELFAVVGHEIGHARNWDMALMTLAQLVPMLFYYIYRTAMESVLDSGDERATAAATGVAVGAYVLYMITEYVVLWFSRTREYHADRFGAQAAGSAAALGRALVKIAYGLAGRGEEADANGRRAGASHKATAIGAMGIFDGGAAQTLAISAQGADTDAVSGKYHIDGEALKGAMKWDLWNPWARWFELQSTHPLIAKRLLHLSELSTEMGEQPVVVFDLPRPESYWDEFAVDICVTLAPTLVLVGGAAYVLLSGAGLVGLGVVLLMAAVAMAAKLVYRYPTGSFPDMSVSTLLRQVKVSGIRPVPCRLEGTVRGKGVAGLVWSDDFVMQDDTGIIFLDHCQPLALWEVLWGWLRGNKLVGGRIEVRGWYRRAPVPFVEIDRFTVDGVARRSWLRIFRWVQVAGVALAGTVIAAGVVAG